MTPNQFRRRYREAKKGDQIIYYTGYTGDLHREHDELRRLVAKHFMMEKVVMIQKKTGACKRVSYSGQRLIAYEYQYIAVKL